MTMSKRGEDTRNDETKEQMQSQPAGSGEGNSDRSVSMITRKKERRFLCQQKGRTEPARAEKAKN